MLGTLSQAASVEAALKSCEEIDKIESKVREKGYTLIPLQRYFVDGRAKVEIGLAKGKKTWDKRHAIAERTAKREAEVAIGRRAKGMG